MSKIYSCHLCNYITKRRYDLDRHNITKHIIKEEPIEEPIEEPKEELIEEQIEEPEEEPIENCKYNICSKCYKKYKCIKLLKEHEEKCNGIDSLTCTRCMKTFTNRHAKSRHIKSNKCKPKSMKYYNNPNKPNNTNSQNNTNNQNNTNSQNNSNNSYNNNNNNTINVYVNDYGKERTDYITFDMLYKILRSVNVIPKYIENKHFNPEYPENHNIKYENNTCLVKKNNKWKKINLKSISSDLFVHNSQELNIKYNSFITIIDNMIRDPDIIEHIRNKINHNYIELTNKLLYNRILNDIKDVITA